MSQLARVVFALLVAATFGAFFVAQRLKSAESVAEYTQLKRFFSPNGDGRRDVDRITFKVKEADELTVTIVNRDGDARAAPGRRHRRPARARRHRGVGRQDRHRRARAGRALPHAARPAAHRPHGHDRRLVRRRHDAADARRAVGHAADRGPVPGSFEIRARGVGRRRAPRFRVLRTDVDPVKEVARFKGRKGSRRARLGRARRRRARAARHLHGRRARPRPLGQRRHRAGRAPAGARPGPRQARHHRPPDHRPAAGGAGPGGRARAVLRRLAPPPLPLERPPRRRVAPDQEGPGRARQDAQPARAARHLRRLPAADPLRPLRRPRAVPRAGPGAGEAARRRADAVVARASTRSTTTATGCRTRSRPAGR